MIYSDYKNSQGKTESVLTKVQQKTDIGEQILAGATVIRDCPTCPIYNELDNELESMKNGGVS